MDVVKTAEVMLNEIPSESFQQLFTTVRYQTSSLGCTQIPDLDSYFFSTSHPHPSTQSSLNAGDVIEIQGPPASGKTHLLYHLIITCILPSSHTSLHIGGWEKGAIVFDTDGTFDMRRLRTLLLSRLIRILPPDSSINLVAEELSDKALRKVHIFRPTSSAQLAATLFHLPVYQTAQMPDDEIALLCIDSVSSFYWPDRFTTEQMRPAQGGPIGTDWVPTLQYVMTALQSFRLSHGPVSVLTNWALNPLPTPPSDSSSGAVTFYRQHLHPFPSPFSPQHNRLPCCPCLNTTCTDGIFFDLTHHITLRLVPILPFSSGTTMEEAKTEEKHRREIVVRGEVAGVVRTPGGLHVGTFGFRVTDEEILVQ